MRKLIATKMRSRGINCRAFCCNPRTREKKKKNTTTTTEREGERERERGRGRVNILGQSSIFIQWYSYFLACENYGKWSTFRSLALLSFSFLFFFFFFLRGDHLEFQFHSFRSRPRPQWLSDQRRMWTGVR